MTPQESRNPYKDAPVSGGSGGPKAAEKQFSSPQVYTFPGEPVPKGRPRSNRSGHTYTPTRTKQAEEAIRWQLKAQGTKPIDQPTLVAVNLQFRCKSQTADLDNLIKLVLDAGQGFLWENDRQVCRIVAEVERGSRGQFTRLTVSPFEQTFEDAA